MRAVIATRPGGPETLRLADRPQPEPGPEDLLVRVTATAVNHADLLQRQGRYPPPEGVTDVLGLEVAGTVTAVGEAVAAEGGWRVGDPVMAVLPGGGYAEHAVVPAAVALPVPASLGLVEAAAVPEVFLTAYDNMVLRGRLAAGEAVLVHGGTSGIGTAAIQLIRRAGGRVIVTASTPAKLSAARALGADAGINYAEEDFTARARELTEGRGVDVVLDVVGASYLEANLRALALEGRLVVIGLQGGAKGELNLGLLLARRLSVTGSTLRARPTADKERLVARFRTEVLPGFDDGSLRPVVDRVLPLEEAAEAHRVMEAGAHVGKIVLRVSA